jgi:hypothetical protein
VTCPTDIIQGAKRAKTRHPQPARRSKLAELAPLLRDRRRYAAQLQCPQSAMLCSPASRARSRGRGGGAKAGVSEAGAGALGMRQELRFVHTFQELL